jgi:TonB-dependent starch-binding outer membrane protein SusC
MNEYFKSPRQFLLLCSFLLINSFLFGQKTIKGTVKDQSTSEPLIGASVVVVENASIGTITDIDGNFTLDVPNDAKSISISYTGYGTQNISLTNSSEYDISLQTDEQLLEDVVVIGYGTVKREDATGAIQNVTSEKFNKGAITSAQELISGKIAGVSITTDGAPGAGSKIRIRGESSLSASNDPLIVIDGIPMDNGGVSGSRNALNIVNPNDIASVSVLKDASATAIYGNRAAAGVILITTKKGTVGSKLRINYNSNYSVGQVTKTVDMLTGDEYRQAIKDKYFDPTKPADMQHPSLKLVGTADTDWQKEIYQSAFGMDHSLGLSGAVGILPYRVSAGYTNKNGILKTDNFKRFTTAVNLSPGFLNNSLQVNFHLKAMVNKNHFADRGAIGNALNFDPTVAPLDAQSKYGGFRTWTIANGNPNTLAPTNPLALLELRNDNSTVNHIITNASIDYRLPFMKDLRLNLSLGHDQAEGEGTTVVPNIASFAFDAINGGGVNNYYTQTKKNSVLESYLNYKKTFDKHAVDVIGGYSWQRFFVDNFYKNTDTAGSASKTSTGSDPGENFLVSLFSRLNYNFKEKYYATFSLRRDGTSRFSPDTRFGLFPAAALSVKVIDSNEKKYLDNIKLRAGWGVTGQQDIGDYYAYLARYQISNPNAQYQFGNEYITTLRPNGYDANIKWEETSTVNVAVDLSLVKDVLSGSIDVYQRKTKDLLNRIPVPAGTNLTNFITTNIGNMENKGIELLLNITPIKGWDISTNFTHNTPKITKLTAIDDPKYQGVATGGIAGGVGSNIQIHSVGYAPSSFFVFKQKYDESGNILEGQYEDLNGDGVSNTLDKYRYKNPSPQYSIGLTNNVSYKNFDFSFAGRANIGNFVYNNVQTDMGYLNRVYGSTGVLWNIHQSAIDNNAQTQANLTFSDHFVKDASFMRLDHITLGYNFKKIGKGLRLYTTVQNPIIVTNYDGLDPELGNGIDNNIYPRARTILGGLSIDF